MLATLRCAEVLLLGLKDKGVYDAISNVYRAKQISQNKVMCFSKQPENLQLQTVAQQYHFEWS